MSTRNSFQQQKAKTYGRKLFTTFLFFVIALYVFGPANPFGSETPTARPQPPELIADLETWLKGSEAQFQNLRPGVEKAIVWAKPTPQITKWAVVYIHGFSATRLETAPLAEFVARALGANLFYTRLTGHGLDGEALGNATAQDWMADTVEAIKIGKVLGDKVLVISCSTGSTLSTWFGTTAESSLVDAMVFVSPNFGLKNKFSELINWPWGQSIAKVIAGDKIEYQSSDPREAVAWTQSYPTRALFPMMALVKKVRNSDLSRFQTPVFVLYSAQDQTVEPFSIKEAYARMGSKIKAIETVDYSRSEGQHVLAGDIRDPQAVGPISQSILKWIKTIDQ